MRLIRPFAAAMAMSVAALTFAPSAEAGHRDRHRGKALVAGMFGLAAGAMIAGALSQPRYRYYEPGPVYVAPPPPPGYGPAPVYYERPQPWTPAWYAYCSDRYRSFDPSTGYFLGYDGRYHFCR